MLKKASPAALGAFGCFSFFSFLALRRSCLTVYKINNNHKYAKCQGRTDLLSAQSLGIRVQTEENALVNEGVLLLRPGTFLDFLARRANYGLDFGAIDEASDIGVGDLGSGKTRWYLGLATAWGRKMNDAYT